MSGQLFQTYFEKGESRFSWPSIAFLGAGGKDFSDDGFLDTIAWVQAPAHFFVDFCTCSLIAIAFSIPCFL